MASIESMDAVDAWANISSWELEYSVMVNITYEIK
jgi:hypothetical protein